MDSPLTPEEAMRAAFRDDVHTPHSVLRRLREMGYTVALAEREAHIDPAEWMWDGHAGHLIVGSQCEFHLATRVGNYRISTVGEYRPKSKHPPSRIGLDKVDDTYAEYETVGAGRLFETFVFRAEGDGYGDVTEWSEIDTEVANDHDTATANHMSMCRKYARLAASLPSEEPKP